jgi:hypothetical protein
LPYEQREQLKDVAKEKLLCEINRVAGEIAEYVMFSLKTAINDRDGDAVEFALFTGFYFPVFGEMEFDSEFSNNLAFILCELIEEDWHHSHEDIASIFQDCKTVMAIEPLYRTALRKFDYLDYDEAYALAVKCIWALGDIDTPESMEKIRLLISSDNPIIRKNAINQLRRHNARKRRK